MLILRIDVTTTLTGLHVDEVELHDTRNRSIHLIAIGIQLFHQFEIHTRSQGYHVGTRAIVALTAVCHAGLKVVIRFAVGFEIRTINSLTHMLHLYV